MATAKARRELRRLLTIDTTPSTHHSPSSTSSITPPSATPHFCSAVAPPTLTGGRHRRSDTLHSRSMELSAPEYCAAPPGGTHRPLSAGGYHTRCTIPSRGGGGGGSSGGVPRVGSELSTLGGTTTTRFDTRMRRTRSASGEQDAANHRGAGGGELQGSSATFCSVPWTSRGSQTPAPVTAPAAARSPPVAAFFPCDNHVGGATTPPSGSHAAGCGGTIKTILMPEITFDEVVTEPSTPDGGAPGGSSPTFERGTGERLSGGSGGARLTLYGDRERFGTANHLQAGVGGGAGAVQHGKAVLLTPRGSLMTLGQSPVEFRESTYSINYSDTVAEDSDEVCLMYSRHEKIPMKDFAAEIRASVDVENFLSQAQLMLDVQASSLEAIMDCMLHHVLDRDEPPGAFQEAKKILFTHESVHQLAKTIQSTCKSYGGGLDYDQSWLCVLCTAPSVQRRNVAIARLKNPANLGRTSQEVWFIVLVVTPTKEKGTKNALETGRTFSTLFADMDLRMRLLAARTDSDFKKLLWEHMKELADEQIHPDRKCSTVSALQVEAICAAEKAGCWFGRGVRADLRRRLPYYLSDYQDGFRGHGTLHKTTATTMFLYFACILPAIALGVLNFNNTKGYIDVKKVIYSQTIGGVFFAIFGGQPMVILLTTAPLALYTKVIYNICEDWDLDFPAMFACTGLWNSFFLLLYAFTDASKLMKWSTRSTEEIFALFMSVAFTVDAFKDVVNDFQKNYHSAACDKQNSSGNLTPTENRSFNMAAGELVTAAAILSDLTTGGGRNQTGMTSSDDVTGGGGAEKCLRENSLLYLLLMLGTVWLGLSLYNFTKTPFLNAGKRALLADSALPVAVILMSFLGSFLFKEIKLEEFELYSGDLFTPASLRVLPWPAVIGAMGLGFSLSLLFFMDQSISGSMVNNPENRLRKGPAYHWDLMVVALLNAFLAYLGLPMVHGALPHSPLHVRAMADMEDRVDQGHVYQKVMRVRETRVTGICCHVLIGLSVLCIEKLKLIPRPVLDGLFLYLAVTALHHNQLFERIMLLVTEQAAYPPNHYIRTVPQRKVHLFTVVQLAQLGVLCAFGFAPLPYLKVVFPILLLLLLPARHKLVPFMVEKRFLRSLDS